MPAECAVNARLAVLTRRQSKGGVGKLHDHVVMAEIAEIAARAAARVGRMLFSELREIGSLVELADDRLRLCLGLDQDVARVDLFAASLFLGEGLVARLELVFCLGCLNRATEESFLDQ